MGKFTRGQAGVETRFEYYWETIIHGFFAFLYIL